jgi:hypothetical protein
VHRRRVGLPSRCTTVTRAVRLSRRPEPDWGHGEPRVAGAREGHHHSALRDQSLSEGEFAVDMDLWWLAAPCRPAENPETFPCAICAGPRGDAASRQGRAGDQVCTPGEHTEVLFGQLRAWCDPRAAVVIGAAFADESSSVGRPTRCRRRARRGPFLGVVALHHRLHPVAENRPRGSSCGSKSLMPSFPTAVREPYET